MKVLREKLLVKLLTSVTLIALLNISLQFDEIVSCFPGVNISFLLMEELAENVEGETEKGSQSLSEIELIVTRENHSFHTQFYTRSIGIVLHSADIPPHPHFDTVTPPPKG
jgi:hypothetical protein